MISWQDRHQYNGLEINWELYSIGEIYSEILFSSHSYRGFTMCAKTATPSQDAQETNGPKHIFIRTRAFGQTQDADLYCTSSKHIKIDAIIGIQRIGSLWRI